MPEDFITRGEYEEHKRREDDENKRLSRRIEILEDTVRELARLPLLVEQIKDNQEKQMRKLEDIDKRPLDALRKSKETAISTAINKILSTVIDVILILLAAGLMQTLAK